MDLTTIATSVAALLVYAGARRVAQENRAKNIALNIAQHPHENFKDGDIQYDTLDYDRDVGLVNKFLFGPERIIRTFFGPHGPLVASLREEDGRIIDKKFRKLMNTNRDLSENVDSYLQDKQREHDADPTGIKAVRRRVDREIEMENRQKEMNNVASDREFLEIGNIKINNMLIGLCQAQIKYDWTRYMKVPKFEVVDFGEIEWNNRGEAWYPNIYIRNAADNISKHFQTYMTSITLVKITWFPPHKGPDQTRPFEVYYDVGQQPVRTKIYHPWEVPGGSQDTHNWQMFPETVLDKNTIVNLGDGKTTETYPVVHLENRLFTLRKGHCWISVADFDMISYASNVRPVYKKDVRRAYTGPQLSASDGSDNYGGGPDPSFVAWQAAVQGYGPRRSPYGFKMETEAERRKHEASFEALRQRGRDEAIYYKTGKHPHQNLIPAHEANMRPPHSN